MAAKWTKKEKRENRSKLILFQLKTQLKQKVSVSDVSDRAMKD